MRFFHFQVDLTIVMLLSSFFSVWKRDIAIIAVEPLSHSRTETNLQSAYFLTLATLELLTYTATLKNFT